MNTELNIPQHHVKVFDLGGVIINIQPEITFNAFAKYLDPKLNPEQAMQEMQKHFTSFEAGAISQEQLLSNFNHILSKKLSMPQFVEIWNFLLLDIPTKRLQTLLQLAKKESIYLLSNTNSIHIEAINGYLKDSFSVNGLNAIFKHCFLSYHMQQRKPDKEIYQSVQTALNIAPERLHFFDDVKENCDAAIANGWQATWVSNDRNNDFWDYLSSQK